MGEFAIEFLRLGEGQEVLATFRDDVFFSKGTHLDDANGIVWRVVGKQKSEFRLIADSTVAVGTFPKGARLVYSRFRPSPHFLPKHPPAIAV